MHIAVISDTHDLLRSEVMKTVSDCDAVIHAGDICTQAILDRFDKPLYAVKGNADKGLDLPLTRQISLEGADVCIAHRIKDLPVSDSDIIITGHTHRFKAYKDNGRLFLNLGSCGPARLFLPVTMAVITIGSTISTERIDIHEAQIADKASVTPKLIRAVCSDADKGLAPDDISSKRGISRELAEQIVRLYVTHPGVDADGIMTKLGL